MERGTFLDRECSGDMALRKRIEALLAAHEQTGSVLATDLQANTRPTISLQIPDLRPDEAVGQTVGHYKLLERIGEGRCGVVYVAEQTEPVRWRVALKVIKLGMDTKQVVVRFEAERQVLAMMDHPNIANILDAGTTETGRPYFVMELVRGIKITEYCDQTNLSTHERLDLFIKVCQAIQHAHQKGIIHRDIKPSNILVTLHDGVPVPKVIDFGIAKATEDRLTDATVYTQLHQFIGTPAYMSPEQAEMSGLDIDTRSDIYSLGVLLYELLAGSTPFDAKELIASGLDAMRKIIREKKPMRPSTRLATLKDDERTTTAKHRSVEVPKLIHQLQGDLDWIAMKCLEKDRARRYETANGLAADLKRHLENEPVVACPPSTAYRIQKAWRRNRLVFGAAAAVAGALVVGFGFSTWQAIRAARAERVAHAAQSKESEAHQEADTSLQNEVALRRQLESTLNVLELERVGEMFAAADASRALSSVELSADPGSGSLHATADPSPDTSRALAYLADILRRSPSNQIAGTRALSALIHYQRAIFLTQPLEHQDKVVSVHFSFDGKRVVTASLDQTFRVWDANKGRPQTASIAHGGPVRSATFSPDGERVLTASDDRTARIWSATTGEPLIEPLRHEQELTGAQFSPDGKAVVTTSTDGTARVWNAATGQPLSAPIMHKARVAKAEFSRDGLWLVTASYDDTAQVWDVKTGQPLTGPLRYQGEVVTASFSPDSGRVVTASYDKSARIWDARTGELVTEALNHWDRVLSAEFSFDGQRVATASADGIARVWDVPLTSSPVPKWVPRLIEAVGTKRLNEHGVVEPVSVEEISALREQLAQSSASDEWTRCGRWHFADQFRRTISPFSSITLGECIENLTEGAAQFRRSEDIGILKAAKKPAHRNGLAMAGFARAIITGNNRSSELSKLAEWYSRRAIYLAPDQPEVWRALGEVCLSNGQLSKAIEVVEAGLAILPQNPELWFEHARMLAKFDNQFEKAHESLTKAIDSARAKGVRISPTLPAYYLSRSYLLSRQGRHAEAAEDFHQAREIPPRDPNTPPGLIDLSLYYNASLVGGCWHAGPLLGSAPENVSPWDLSEVPRGVQKLVGMPFDIRGAIQVGGPTRTGEFHPTKLSGIVVDRLCKLMHFLHSAIYGNITRMNKPIGKYIVHFQSGQSSEIPLVCGRDLDDWRLTSQQSRSGQLQVAWNGGDPGLRVVAKPWLFKTTWENPFPDQPVSTIDFEGNSRHERNLGFPFLVALTA